MEYEEVYYKNNDKSKLNHINHLYKRSIEKLNKIHTKIKKLDQYTTEMLDAYYNNHTSCPFYYCPSKKSNSKNSSEYYHNFNQNYYYSTDNNQNDYYNFQDQHNEPNSDPIPKINKSEFEKVKIDLSDLAKTLPKFESYRKSSYKTKLSES